MISSDVLKEVMLENRTEVELHRIVNASLRLSIKNGF